MSVRRGMPRANPKTSNHEIVKGTEFRTGRTRDPDEKGEPCKTCGPHICPGFQLHFWRKVCQYCRCPESEHMSAKTLDNMEEATRLTLNGLFKVDNYDEMSGSTQVDNVSKSTSGTQVLSTLDGSRKGSSAQVSNCEQLKKIKTGTTKNLVAKFMENIPEEEKEEGATYRQKQLLMQLPAHDIDGKACKTLMTTEEKQEMEEFRQHRQEHALGQGLMYTIGQKRDMTDEHKSVEEVWDCQECTDTLKKGETAIFTDKTGGERCWHAKCFVCFKCKELLVDLIYFHKDDHVYCGRHHAELVKPRCKACDELIFTGEYTHAEDADWHIVHFCCWRCDELLGGKRYISREGHPFCLGCFDKEFGKKCNTCNKAIAADESHLTHKDMTWHGNDECFTCHTCKKSLVGKPFLPRLDHIFCCRACYKVYKEANMELAGTPEVK
ncbi:testin-like [Sycon ciliatum]|uniref:testin-like n=1 Tax=Sycon ciliatum TaxID=27933 RepID=UPI0020ADAC26|eukprot:scpid62610/ scgid12171/ Testin